LIVDDQRVIRKPGVSVAYYIYRVFPFARLEKVTQFEAFKDASAEAKRLRAVGDQAADCKLKVIFCRERVAGGGSAVAGTQGRSGRHRR